LSELQNGFDLRTDIDEETTGAESLPFQILTEERSFLSEVRERDSRIAKRPVDLERSPGSENILARSVDNLSLTKITSRG
jgi:hypothetical protein